MTFSRNQVEVWWREASPVTSYKEKAEVFVCREGLACCKWGTKRLPYERNLGLFAATGGGSFTLDISDHYI
jgi:hypothetical protein